jgi:hypothetical protein
MKDFKKCNVLIYDEADKQLANVKIWEHDTKSNTITVQDWPELSGVERCKLLILTSPVPYSYIGIARKEGLNRLIRLFEEHMEENRHEIRYKTELTGNIEALIYDKKSYPLHTALEIKVINISKSGMRLQAKNNTLTHGDRFALHIRIGENDKLLTGKVANFRDDGNTSSEYGCRLVREGGEQH